MTKKCIDCNISFKVRGQNHIRCDACARKVQYERSKAWRLKNVYKGIGSGSNTGWEKDNPYYRHGRCVFRRWAKERLKFLSYRCERCGTIIDASKRGTWAGHHKDHNPSNNIRENLEILCRRCHAIEHECWKAFKV